MSGVARKINSAGVLAAFCKIDAAIDPRLEGAGEAGRGGSRDYRGSRKYLRRGNPRPAGREGIPIEDAASRLRETAGSPRAAEAGASGARGRGERGKSRRKGGAQEAERQALYIPEVWSPLGPVYRRGGGPLGRVRVRLSARVSCRLVFLFTFLTPPPRRPGAAALLRGQ